MITLVEHVISKKQFAVTFIIDTVAIMMSLILGKILEKLKAKLFFL